MIYGRNVFIKNKGIGFLGLSTLVLVVLRFTEVIMWSWLWVFAPLWIPALIALLGGIIFYLLLRYL